MEICVAKTLFIIPKHMSEMFLMRMLVVFLDLTVAASIMANPACISMTRAPMDSRK